MAKFFLRVVFPLFILGVSNHAWGGVLVSPAATWTNFSFRPAADEPTPNYFGYGGALTLGYSVGQILDFAMYGNYVPATLRNAKLGEEDATLIIYGGRIGMRMAKTIYFGLFGGRADYHLIRQKNEYEILGRCSGPAGGVSLGAIFEVDKKNFWQTSVEMLHAVTTSNQETITGKKRIDVFMVSVAFVYNHYKNTMIENTLFKGFLNSLLW